MILAYVHGPFDRNGNGQMKDFTRRAIVDAVKAGACDCAICKRTGGCEPMPEEICWLRANRRDGEGLYLANHIGEWWTNSTQEDG